MLPKAVVEDLSEVPAMDENALDVFVGTANENSKAFKLDSLLILTNILISCNLFEAIEMALYLFLVNDIDLKLSLLLET